MDKIDFKIIRYMKVLLNKGGYVMDFSNSTFSDFFLLSIDEDIDDEKYKINGNSKGKRLETFLDIAPLVKIVNLSLDSLKHWDIFEKSKTDEDKKLYETCKKYFENLLNSGYKLVKTSMEVTLTPSILSHKFILEQISKANKKIETGDYSGAITNARALIEQVLIELSTRFEIKIKNKGNLQNLYKPIAEKMNLTIKSDSSDNIKKILSGFF